MKKHVVFILIAGLFLSCDDKPEKPKSDSEFASLIAEPFIALVKEEGTTLDATSEIPGSQMFQYSFKGWMTEELYSVTLTKKRIAYNDCAGCLDIGKYMMSPATCGDKLVPFEEFVIQMMMSTAGRDDEGVRKRLVARFYWELDNNILTVYNQPRPYNFSEEIDLN